MMEVYLLWEIRYWNGGDEKLIGLYISEEIAKENQLKNSHYRIEKRRVLS